MNLLLHPWLPFQLRDGTQQTLPLCAIVDQNVVDFALPRADFQGAAYQFAIGVLQTIFAPENMTNWCQYYQTPPTSTTLIQQFERIAHAFNATGSGPLFMQDWDLLEDRPQNKIAGLLIDAPGMIGIKNNTDHFIKRHIGEVMSLEMAMLALFTLQINAPSGGRGHLVGLRGGGPLTTLVLPADNAPLWKKLWLNVLAQPDTEPDLHSATTFPWLGPTKNSETKGSEIYADSVHPLHMYWAMPRRIRLVVEDIPDICHITGQSATQTVRQYRTQPYGNNYSGDWLHPLTPYRKDPKKPDAPCLSIKGQPGGINYKMFDTLLFSAQNGNQQAAQVVMQFHEFYKFIKMIDDMLCDVPRLWVFGYDMDKMKPRGWYSVILPLFSVPPEQQEILLQQIKELQLVAQTLLSQCRSAISQAWFVSPKDIRGDLSFIDCDFWQRSEPAFFKALQQMVQQGASTNYRLTTEQATTWLKQLRDLVLNLFDHYVFSASWLLDKQMTKAIPERIKLRSLSYAITEIKQFRTNYNITSEQGVST